MTSREYVLLIDDDRNVTEGLVGLLEQAGRTTIVCSDVESAEIMLTRLPVTHIITDVQFSGSFGFEGLHFLERMRRSVHPSCRIVLMTGYATDELRTAATRMGAAAILSKPFTYDEVTEALASTSTCEGAYETIRVPTLDELLDGGLLSVAFQPIVSTDGELVNIFGYEALTRVKGWPAGGPAELFDYAEHLGRLTELNVAAVECAIAESHWIPAEASLFINVDPVVFRHEGFQRMLRAAATQSGLSLSRLVLEITERSGLGENVASLSIFGELRADGVRFALDDQGSAYSHLSSIGIIRPSFIKISQMFGTAFEEDATRTRIVRHVTALSKEFGCRTVLEGIESVSTALAAAAEGIDLLQGFHFGRPAAGFHSIPATQFESLCFSS